jgi:hypothetical protein
MQTLAKHSGRLTLACALASFASAAHGATIEVTPAAADQKASPLAPMQE